MTGSGSALKVARRSAWELAQIEDYLGEARIPLRLACNGGKGFPSLASLWFEYGEGAIWCATHASSAILRLLGNDPRCAFEIATNEAPYHGVRGQAEVTLMREGSGELLERLIARYLGDSNPALARWLLSRVDEEYALCLRPTWVSAWDYRGRMAAAAP